MNPDMPLSNVRQIKEYLIRNKAAYDAERFEEYLERRQMRKEEEEMDILMNNEAAGRLENEAIEERQQARTQARDDLWKQEVGKQVRVVGGVRTHEGAEDQGARGRSTDAQGPQEAKEEGQAGRKEEVTPLIYKMTEQLSPVAY